MYVQHSQTAPPELRLPAQPEAVADRILRVDEVAYLLGVSRGTVYNRIREKGFPAPVSLGGRLVGWRLSTVQAHLRGLTQRSEVAA